MNDFILALGQLRDGHLLFINVNYNIFAIYDVIFRREKFGNLFGEAEY